MKDITFYFVPEVATDFITGKKVEVFRPKIPIRFLTKNRRVMNPFDCLFDTGADRILLPGDLGKVLGLDVKKGLVGKTVGIDNVPIVTYTHQITLYVGSFRIYTEADFAFENRVSLLGRNGFMDKFEKIEFNENKRYIKLFYS